MGEKSNKWSSETVKKLAKSVSDAAQPVLEEARIKAEPLMKDVKAATKPYMEKAEPYIEKAIEKNGTDHYGSSCEGRTGSA